MIAVNTYKNDINTLLDLDFYLLKLIAIFYLLCIINVNNE